MNLPLTLLVGFTKHERCLLDTEILKTDRCIYPLPELNGKILHADFVTKVIINSNLNFEREYTKWYHILPSKFAICMYSLDIERNLVIDEIDHVRLFAYKTRKLNLEVLNELGYESQIHFQQSKSIF